MNDDSQGHLDALIRIFLGRMDVISRLSLQRFGDLYRKHPGFAAARIEHPPFPEPSGPGAAAPADKIDKIVFLLGAGTSASAGIPLASAIIKSCRTALGHEILEREVRAIREKLRKEQEQEGVKSPYALSDPEKDAPTFEEVLTAYKNIFGEEQVLSLMRKYFLVPESEFPKKTRVTLFNECLAHLAREHLADFIVTLNFDELLEFSLDEDIGPHAYVKIVSPAQFQWALSQGLTGPACSAYSNPDQRESGGGCDQAKVWLLKPHGTITQENTMRHLIEQVWRFEREKERVLQEVFKNAYVIVVGYSLSAADLHQILIMHSMADSIKGIFWVEPSGKFQQPFAANLKAVMDKQKAGSFHLIKMDAEEFARRIFEGIYLAREKGASAFRKYGLMPPYRHLLRAYVFRRGEVPCTFENRFVAELVQYGIRMKGWFSSRVINKSHQIQHLLAGATKSQKSIITDIPGRLDPFYQSFPREGRTERLFVLRRTFKQSVRNSKDAEFVKRIEDCIPSIMKNGRKRKRLDPIAELAARMAGLLQTFPDVSPYESDTDVATFRNSLIIPNKSVLDFLTQWLLNRPRLHMVTETGALLQEGITRLKGNIAMAALGDYPEELKSVRRMLQGTVPIRRAKSLAQSFYLKDIEKGANRVRRIMSLGGHCTLIPPCRKRFHLTLWEDTAHKQAAGVVFERVDRQAGSTFSWICLDLRKPGDEADQFEALKRYATLRR